MLTLATLSGEVFSTQETLVGIEIKDCVISGSGVISGGVGLTILVANKDVAL